MNNYDSCEGIHGLWGDLYKEKGKTDFTIIGVPFDELTCCRRGAQLGPERIRHWSMFVPPVSEDKVKMSNISVSDEGNIIIKNPVPDFKLIEKKIESIANIPIILGGDHSVTIPVLKAMREKYKDKRLGVLWIDAHVDLCDKFYGSKLSHACVMRRALEYGIKEEDVCMIGIRSYEEQEVDFVEKSKLNIYTMMDVAEQGINSIAKQANAVLSRCDAVYVSFDIDGLDTSVAPGTGIPDAGGLSMREALTIIKSLQNLPIVGFDLVEVAPSLDPSESTVFAALKIIMEFMALAAKNKLKK